jgi:putative IMPACT (imprinted ancient) family translation regulator
MGFLTLAGPGIAELRIRGSSFLAFAAPAASEEEAREVLATHVVFRDVAG